MGLTLPPFFDGEIHIKGESKKKLDCSEMSSLIIWIKGELIYNFTQHFIVAEMPKSIPLKLGKDAIPLMFLLFLGFSSSFLFLPMNCLSPPPSSFTFPHMSIFVSDCGRFQPCRELMQCHRGRGNIRRSETGKVKGLSLWLQFNQ